MDFVGYTRQCYYGTYRTNIATIVLPSIQVHCLGRILIFWLLPFTSKKNKGAVSHGYSRNHVKTYGQVLFSAIFPLVHIVGRSCRTDPAPLGFRQIPAIKALCRCKDLNLASSYACLSKSTHLIPNDVCHQRQMGIFAALKSPPKNVATHFLIG